MDLLIFDLDGTLIDSKLDLAHAVNATRAHMSMPALEHERVYSYVGNGAPVLIRRALGEQVTWDDRMVTSVDWRTYRSLTMGAEMPVVESVLINRPDGEAMGAGETAITLTAAAIGNAVFDATGARLREVPFTPERVKAALETASR